MADQRSDRGAERSRRDEAQDPDRPIDPDTGEKEGLGPRDVETTDTTTGTETETTTETTETPPA
jgi:hypothetical protein